MSDPENKRADSSELAELREQCADLNRQTSLLLVGLIVAAFTLTAFLGVQSIRADKELNQMQEMLNQTRREEANVRAIGAKLLEYGRTHPDIMPMLSKYGITPNAGYTNAAPAPAKK